MGFLTLTDQRLDVPLFGVSSGSQTAAKTLLGRELNSLF
jgi:hypothetical protein